MVFEDSSTGLRARPGSPAAAVAGGGSTGSNASRSRALSPVGGGGVISSAAGLVNSTAGLISSAKAGALLTTMSTPHSRCTSPLGLASQPLLQVLGGFSSSSSVVAGFSDGALGDRDSAAAAAAATAAAAGCVKGNSSSSSSSIGLGEGSGLVQGLGTALRLNPAGGTPALRVTGQQCDGGSNAAAAAAAAAMQPPGAVVAAMGGYQDAGSSGLLLDNSQAKPVYAGLVMKGPSAAADLVVMCRRLWLMAWPLCWMEVLAFAKELIITSYVGHLGAAELSALVLAQTVYNVTGNAPMLGFVTAMETFCGQAYGAQRYKLVGLVLQRGLVISFMYCCAALWSWQFNGTLLVWMGQDPSIAASAHKLTLALGPALFFDAADQCCRRYLSSQAIVKPLMCVTAAATLLTPLYLWMCIGWLRLGLIGAAVAWDAVQATSLALMAGACWWYTRQQQPGRCTWPGWSRDAFREWRAYTRMALPSCVMICLDWWTFEVIVMLSGLLPHPEQTMAMMGITFNIHALCFFAAHGLSGAASTRVGNDLGAGRPHMAWLTVQVAVLLGTVVMCASSVVLLLSRNQIGRLFSSEYGVVMLTAQAVPPLAVSLIGEGANTVLAGVMRGCGRQRIGAIINLVTYWLFGLPVACLLAFPGKLGALGLWTGLACTASVQALLMSLTVFKFNWVNEASKAKALVAAGELVLEDEQSHLTDPSTTTLDAPHQPPAGLQHRTGPHKQQQQQYGVAAEQQQQQQQQQCGRQSPLDHRVQMS